MESYFVIFFGGFLISLLYRSMIIYFYKNFFKQGFVGDSSVHFGIIKQLKKNWSSKRIEQYVIPNELTYPLAFHHYCNLFPLNLLSRFSFIPNILIFSLFFGLYSSYLHYLESEILNRNDYALLLIGGFFFLFSISNLQFRGPEVAYIKLSERLLARVGTGLYFLFIFIYLVYGDKISGIFSICVSTIPLLTSKFARQLMIVSSLLLSVIYLSIYPLIFFGLSFILAFLISGRYFLKSFQHGLKFINIYNLFNKKSRFVKPGLSNLLNLKFVFNRIRKGAFSELFFHLRTREPSRSIMYFPEIVFLFGVSFLNDFALSVFLFKPIIVILIIYLITSTKKFNHLGESYRYIEYGLFFYLPFSVALLLVQISDAENVQLNILSYGLSVLILLFLLTVHQRPNYPESDLFSSFLEKISLKGSDVVFPIGMRLGADLCARASCSSFWWQPGGITDPVLYKEYIEEYPYLKRNWQNLFKKHSVTHVICRKSSLDMVPWNYDFSNLKLVHEDKNYIAYKMIQKRHQ